MPSASCQWPVSRATRKVADTAEVTKNSAVLVVPIDTRGSWPDPTRVVVTVGPQPPPPMASKKPPARPSGPAKRRGNSRSRVCRVARQMMTRPMIAR